MLSGERRNEIYHSGVAVRAYGIRCDIRRLTDVFHLARCPHYQMTGQTHGYRSSLAGSFMAQLPLHCNVKCEFHSFPSFD